MDRVGMGAVDWAQATSLLAFSALRRKRLLAINAKEEEKMKRGILTTIGLILLFLVTSAPAYSAPNEHLDWGAQLHSGASACPDGTLVINVVQKVLNDNDSGVAGNAWAYDDFVRQIQVVETAAGEFCATVKYQGNFTTIEGPSPNNTGTVGDGIVGTFQGGYVSTVFDATLKTAPLARTKGSIGTYDYNCDTASQRKPDAYLYRHR
ncbi:MAG: hypothetical protein HY663_01790 [Chloroflexi bacterium]|nr:hypothetical protein [Chloroflexota bacterium]